MSFLNTNTYNWKLMTGDSGNLHSNVNINIGNIKAMYKKVCVRKTNIRIANNAISLELLLNFNVKIVNRVVGIENISDKIHSKRTDKDTDTDLNGFSEVGFNQDSERGLVGRIHEAFIAGHDGMFMDMEKLSYIQGGKCGLAINKKGCFLSVIEGVYQKIVCFTIFAWESINDVKNTLTLIAADCMGGRHHG